MDHCYAFHPTYQEVEPLSVLLIVMEPNCVATYSANEAVIFNSTHSPHFAGGECVHMMCWMYLLAYLQYM